MLDKIVESCRFLLNNFPEAQQCRDYLNARIGAESQEEFQFGYFPDMKNLKALTDLVGDDVLIKENLLDIDQVEDSLSPRQMKTSYLENFPLIMPYRDAYGRISGLVARTLLDESEMKLQRVSKYKNSRESKRFKKGNMLFGLFENKQHIIDNDSVYIVEGQFDVIKASEKGFKNIVALGNNSMTPYQFSVISRYTDNIFLLLDNDKSGENGRKRIMDKYGQMANIQNFYLPEEYKDIDEYFTKSGESTVSFVVKV